MSDLAARWKRLRRHPGTITLLYYSGTPFLTFGVAVLHRWPWLSAVLFACAALLMAPELAKIPRTMRRGRQIRKGWVCRACKHVGRDGLEPAGRVWRCTDEAACLARGGTLSRREVIR